MTQVFYDCKGKRVALGPELGRGGEGVVFSLEATSDYVAKLYSSPVSQQKALKLAHMTKCQTRDLGTFAAWPCTTLHEHPSTDRVRGFVMPKFPTGAHEIHQIYDIKTRFKHFPGTDWGFLTHTATNCATAFETIHATGHVIGDVNNNNVVVSPNATVFLIDCDSYQISVNGTLHRCEVGVPEYTPPELHNGDFSQTVRTANHDNFGLAVLIFQLLFMRHPFSGRFIGQGDPPEMPKLIQEFRFPFSKNAKQYQMEPPPYWPTLDILPDAIGNLFERAFARSTLANARPTGTEWREALTGLKSELRRCNFDSSHVFYRGRANCPWCQTANDAGVEFFVTLVYSNNKLVAAVFCDRAEELRNLLFQFDRLRVEDHQVAFLNAPQVVIPPFPQGPQSPVCPRKPDRPQKAVLPVEPNVLEMGKMRQRYIRFVAIGIVSSIIGLGGGYAAFLTWGIGPTTFIGGTALFGCWLAWFFSLSAHPYLRAKPQYELETEYYAIALKKYSCDVAEYDGKLIQYQAGMSHHQLQIKEYKVQMQSHSLLKKHYDDHRQAYEQNVKDIDIKLGESHQLRALLNESLLRYRAFYDHYDLEFKGLATEHRSLKPSCDVELLKLRDRAKEEQLKVFLEDISIHDHKIPQVGRARFNTLTAYGIVNAWHITHERLNTIPRLGPAYESLLSWRYEREREFRFDGTTGVPPATSAAIVRKWQRQQRSIEGNLAGILQNTKDQQQKFKSQFDNAKSQIGILRQVIELKLDEVTRIVERAVRGGG
jgi:DNA-binding helix-hairpin-helix protein with protein kinase domain